MKRMAIIAALAALVLGGCAGPESPQFKSSNPSEWNPAVGDTYWKCGDEACNYFRYTEQGLVPCAYDIPKQVPVKDVRCMKVEE